MIRIASLKLSLAFALVAIAGCAQAAGDAAAGEQKSQPCAACHGADGNKTIDAQYPRLAGQYADYLARALHEYKSGDRKNAVMAGFVATLDDHDIENLAAFYASKDGDIDDLSHLK